MNVVNVHKRIINQSKMEVSKLIETLSTKNDSFWPIKYWPAMRFKEGLKMGSKGGHGIIKYVVEDYVLGDLIVFKFLKPIGFNGIHKFEIEEVNASATVVKHSIIMKTEGMATLKWVVAIRWLHDALIENAFDTIENNFLEVEKFTKWNLWVRFWRFLLR